MWRFGNSSKDQQMIEMRKVFQEQKKISTNNLIKGINYFPVKSFAKAQRKVNLLSDSF